VNKFGSLNMIT